MTNIVGTKHIALLVEDNENETQYITTPISSKRLTSFISGKIDLREIFDEPEIEQFYTFNYDGNDVVAYTYNDPIPQEFLPDKGFVYGEILDEDQTIVKEAVEKQNAVVHLSLSDKENSHSIMADNLGDILKYYQLVIENSFKKNLSKATPENRAFYSRQENYKLRAFAASPGSFNLHMFAEAQTDLFGSSIIEIALRKFDEIIAGTHTNEELLAVLRSVKGHTISSLKHFLQKIISLDLTIKHKWYAPDQSNVHVNYIDKSKAEIISKLLNASEELAEEIKEFTGYFVQLDTDKGTWRISNTADNKEYSGVAPNDVSLLGITLDTKWIYKIICNEVLEEAKVSEKEKTKLILINIEMVNSPKL